MRIYPIIFGFVGTALLILTFKVFKPKSVSKEGYTNSEVWSIQHQAEIDSCVNVAETYIKAADLLDQLVDSSNSGLQARDVQVQYLDSAAKYKKAADLLIPKP